LGKGRLLRQTQKKTAVHGNIHYRITNIELRSLVLLQDNEGKQQ